MKTILAIVGIVLFASCSRLGDLPVDPPQAPAAWLAAQPHLDLSPSGIDLVLIQPSSTLIVYGLGLLTIAMGLRFLALRRKKGATGLGGESALLFWGLALVVWGTGTLAAGTSYQAFGYMIKGAGLPTMAWTSWWELAYMMLTVASLSLMTLAVSAASASVISKRGWVGKALGVWALASTPAYVAFVLVGVARLDRFMLSFEAMVLFVIPSMLAFFAVNLGAWIRLRRRIDLYLIGAWLGMLVVMATYFGCYLAGMGPALWERGLWFSENDVLHLGLVAWMLWLGLAVAPALAKA